MKYAIKGLLLCVLVTGVRWAGDKHPVITPRDIFAMKLVQPLLEQLGREHGMVTFSTGSPGECGNQLYHYGKGDCLCVMNFGNDVFDMDKYFRDQLTPRLKKMKALGFVEINYIKLGPEQHSFANYTHFPITAGPKDSSPVSIGAAVQSIPSSVSDSASVAANQSDASATLLGATFTNSNEGGVEIRGFLPNSPIQVVGLHAGDVIISVDGKRVRSVPELEAALADRISGSTVHLGYMFHTNLGWMPGTEKVLTLEAQGK